MAALLAAAVTDELAELDAHGEISVHSPSIRQGYRRLLELIMAVDDANRHIKTPGSDHQAIRKLHRHKAKAR